MTKYCVILTLGLLSLKSFGANEEASNLPNLSDLRYEVRVNMKSSCWGTSLPKLLAAMDYHHCLARVVGDIIYVYDLTSKNRYKFNLDTLKACKVFSLNFPDMDLIMVEDRMMLVCGGEKIAIVQEEFPAHGLYYSTVGNSKEVSISFINGGYQAFMFEHQTNKWVCTAW